MNIVISGANSYIGNSIQSYIAAVDGSITVSQLDVSKEEWNNFDFGGVDVVVHVAAIVHRKDVDEWNLYERVNVGLTKAVAEKAKSQGVRQFVFISSMAVYGIEKSLSTRKGLVTGCSEPTPNAMYGKSKYMAEEALLAMESDSFAVSIVRPPNVYGPGCRGGYITTYMSIVKKLPVIPGAFQSVKQSVLYIDNLSRFVYLIIRDHRCGIFTPQDKTAVSAVDIMNFINRALNLGKKTSKFFGLFVYPLSFLPIVKKGYGGVAYDVGMSHHDEIDYLSVTTEEGIKRTVLHEIKRNNPNL